MRVFAAGWRRHASRTQNPEELLFQLTGLTSILSAVCGHCKIANSLRQEMWNSNKTFKRNLTSLLQKNIQLIALLLHFFFFWTWNQKRKTRNEGQMSDWWRKQSEIWSPHEIVKIFHSSFRHQLKRSPSLPQNGCRSWASLYVSSEALWSGYF